MTSSPTMHVVQTMFNEFVGSSQLRWTVFSVVANMSLTLAIWVGIYGMKINEEVSKMYFLDTSFDSTTGNPLYDGLINGFGTIFVLGSVSFVMLAFVLYDFQKIVKGWLALSCLLILFGVSAQTLHDLFSQIFEQQSKDGFFWTVLLTSFFTLVYGVTGIFAFLTDGSLWLHQCFVVSNCSLIAVFYLRAFPQLTTWFVLWAVLFWDIFAVLTSIGPLRRVQTKASDYSSKILKFLMFAADEKRICGGADAEEELNEERTIRRDVKQLIQMYSQREAQDDEFVQKIRKRRIAVNPDSGISEQSPLVETDPSPVQNEKEKNSDDDEESDEESTDDSSSWSLSSYSSCAEDTGVSTAEEFDPKQWNEVAANADWDDESRESTAADALNDGETLRLGFGDFVFYSLLVGQAASAGCPVAVLAAALGILLGLIATLTVLSSEETTTPALPLPVICGTFSYFGSKFVWNQFFG